MNDKQVVKRKRGSGSRKGVPNVLTREIKDMIRGALEDAGGQKYLAAQAKENPAAFLSLLGKIIPRDIRAEIHNPYAEIPDEGITRRRKELEKIVNARLN